MKNVFKLYSLILLDFLGINALCRFLNRRKAIILWYHGICDEGFTLTKRHLPKSIFRRQLTYLKKKNYIFVSLTELVNALKNGEKVDKYVVLTFDDGFKNIVENAYPIMKESGAKGCFYLVSDLIGTNNLLWTDQIEVAIKARHHDHFQFDFMNQNIVYKLDSEESYQRAFEDIKSKLRTISDRERQKYLEQFNISGLDDIPKEFFMADWNEIKELDQNILEIGIHTRKHPNCTNLTTDAEVEDEILNSKIDVEKNIGRKMGHFCYPAGAYDDRIITMVKKSGYASAVSIENGFNDQKSDLYRLKRMVGYEQFPLFKFEISGTHELLKRLKKFF